MGCINYYCYYHHTSYLFDWTYLLTYLLTGHTWLANIQVEFSSLLRLLEFWVCSCYDGILRSHSFIHSFWLLWRGMKNYSFLALENSSEDTYMRQYVRVEFGQLQCHAVFEANEPTKKQYWLQRSGVTLHNVKWWRNVRLQIFDSLASTVDDFFHRPNLSLQKLWSCCAWEIERIPEQRRRKHEMVNA